MQVTLLHSTPHTPLHATLAGLFQNASRVQLAVAFLTAPGVASFLRLVPAGPVRSASRVVASIRWPTSLDALASLSAQMPNGLHLHRGLLLPAELNLDRPLMHSKVVHVEHVGSDEVDILVGSHNWTGQALDGNNLEASVHVRCKATDLFAAEVGRHLDGCFAESELFDSNALEDYRAIQIAMHAGPTRSQGETAGFTKESVVVLHAEEEPGLTARLGDLHLYLPVRQAGDDDLFEKDQRIHLYVYQRGELFAEYDPLRVPVLFTGRVEMSNRPSDPAPRPADCVIGDFARPELVAWVGSVPQEPGLTRQLVAVLRPERRGRILFYHHGPGGPRFRRFVSSRPLTEAERGRVAEGRGRADERYSPMRAAYTDESIDRDGAFVYAAPADPDIRCVISLPSRELYPSDAAEEFLSRVRGLNDEARSRARVEFEAPARSGRKYVYKCTHRVDLEMG